MLGARAGVIRTEEEKTLWMGVTVDFMSDEENAEVGGIGVWLVKSPSFRAPVLTDICNTLQAGMEEDPQLKGLAHPKKKGVVSTRSPPPNYDQVHRQQTPVLPSAVQARQCQTPQMTPRPRAHHPTQNQLCKAYHSRTVD